MAFPLFAIALSLLAAFVLAWSWPLASDLDLYLHLKEGQFLWETGSLPWLDRYSYTAVGTPNEVHSWLSQLVLYLVHHEGGEAGVRLLNWLLIVSMLCLVSRWTWKRTRSFPIVLTASTLAILLHQTVQTFRPLVFGEALGLFFLFHVFSSPRVLSQTMSGAKPFALSALAVLWANLHPSALLLLPCAGWLTLYQLRNRARKMPGLRATLAPMCLGLAVLLNPTGYKLPGLALQTAKLGRALEIGEWQPALPISFSQSAGITRLHLGLDARSWTLYFLMAALFFFGARCLRKRRWDYRLGIHALLLFLALTSARHTPFLLFPLVSTLCLAARYLRLKRYVAPPPLFGCLPLREPSSRISLLRKPRGLPTGKARHRLSPGNRYRGKRL